MTPAENPKFRPSAIKPGDIVFCLCPTGAHYFDVVRSLFEQTDTLGRSYPALVLTHRSWVALADAISVRDLSAKGGAIVANILASDDSERASEVWERAYAIAFKHGEPPDTASLIGDIAYALVLEGQPMDEAIANALQKSR